ncbi:MAG: amidohydrolase family protein, partial [Gammaproteobacteria bacterium]|nr:amidohydrolase family protein [Gammaproteobacteria bacterium]
MKSFLHTFLLIVFASNVIQAQAENLQTVLFKNVKVFNGSDDQLYAQDVLVEGNMITAVGKKVEPTEGVEIIDGGG